MKYCKLFLIFALSFGPALWHASAADDKRAPTWNCTTPACGAPTGGTYMDQYGNTICPQCFHKQFGTDNRVWDNGAGAYVPPGGGGVPSCEAGCHR